jgi:RNA polymerase sigma factor (sigma-70 family)
MSVFPAKKTLIVDEQFLTRKSLETLINNIEGFKVIHETDSYIDLIKVVDKQSPDILVISLSNCQYEVYMKFIRSIPNNIRTLIFINEISSDRVVELHKYNVLGLLTKYCSFAEIELALKTISENKPFVCDRITEELQKSTFSIQKSSLLNSLSKRENEILVLIANGLTTKKIAQKLYLSIHTVNNHRKNILKKLKVKSPVQLISFALESGIIDTKDNS